MEFYKISFEFLKSAGIAISKNYLRERLESHPEYPALISLTDLLDEFEIENRVMRITDKSKWKELELPFMVHTSSSNGFTDFAIIKSKKISKNLKDILNKWDGIVTTIERNRKIAHREHKIELKKERLQKYLVWILVSLFLALMVINLIISFSTVIFMHFMFSIVGLLISITIIAYSLGAKTDFSELFCKVEEEGCNKVLNSKLGKFGGDIGLGDISAIFFASIIVYLGFSSNFDTETNILFLTSITSVAVTFTFISFFYQWSLKSWCKLCLAIIAVLWIQFINLIFNISSVSFSVNKVFNLPPKVYTFFGLSIILASFWFVIKSLLISAKQVLHQKIRIRKWRQDPQWFDALLPLHKKIDDSFWEKEIFYGNPSGVLQIVMVSNPYCDACAKAHTNLDKIYKKHRENVGIRIRFTLKSFEPDNQKYKAVFEIFNAYEELVWKIGLHHKSGLMKKIVTDWFDCQDLELWREQYRFQKSNQNVIDNLIKKSMDWSDKTNITQTPAFFINGFEMPNPHTFEDLLVFVSEYIEILKSRQL